MPRPLVAAAALLVVIAGCGGSAGGGGEARPGPAKGQSSSPPTTEEPVAAAVLAAMDERSATIGDYRDLLGTLQPRCQEPPNRIADFVVDAQQRMADHARVESMLTVLRAIVAAVPPGRQPTDCAAVALAVAKRMAP